MLAEPLETTDLEHYFKSTEWCCEPKLDGHRIVIVVTDGTPTALNRRGEPFKNQINPRVLEEFTGTHFGKGIWIFDGEYMDVDKHFYVFDLIETPRGSLTEHPMKYRRELLDALFNTWKTFHVHLVPCATTEHGKRDLYRRVVDAGAEGVMWKLVDGKYAPGKRSLVWRKTKLWKEADVVVLETWREGKRSVGIGVYSNDTLVDVGACSMTERNLARLQPGSVITVKYLYAGAGGRLFQPAFRRVRLDKNPEECLVSQLKHVNKNPVL